MRPQAVRRSRTLPVSHKPKPTRADWAGLAITCALWAAGVAVAAFIVYTIATVPAGWWIPGGLPR